MFQFAWNQSATRIGAEVLGLDDELGTIEQGKIADMVVSGANPLEDISMLGIPNNISIIMQSGKIVKCLNGEVS